jgi:hypothetical protein
MHKLNVDFTDVDKPKQQKRLDKFNDWATPIGWWHVTTEGDCEGRTTNNLGDHYGHIADIAFALADKCHYSLQFRPDVAIRSPGITAQRKATGRGVHISFYDGPFRMQNPNEIDVSKWMNIEGVSVTECNYYGAVTLTARK